MLYPLTFHPIFKERVWGGRQLERLYHKNLPPRTPIGESWEISDRPCDVSVVANGPLAGKDLLELKLVDEIVPEPLGGAHNDPAATGETLKTHLLKHLNELLALPTAERLKKRYEKYRAHGHFLEKIPPPAEQARPAVNGAVTATAAPAA